VEINRAYRGDEVLTHIPRKPGQRIILVVGQRLECKQGAELGPVKTGLESGGRAGGRFAFDHRVALYAIVEVLSQNPRSYAARGAL
jgi:hypothetical protein